MPELPEVETIARKLQNGTENSPSIVDKKVAKVNVLWHKTLAEPSQKTFSRRIVGQTIQKVDRRGKYIQIHLSSDFLLIHLRMSGDIMVGQGIDPLGSHPRLVIYFKDGWQLSFTDARKFGRVWLVSDTEIVTGKLGPEPLDDTFDKKMFLEMLNARKRQIKPLLLDQSFIAGVGNIYADESLNLAKIHPLSQSNQLSEKQSNNLLDAIRKVLNNGIESYGASIDWVYRGGEYQNKFRVYDRSGKPCLECGTIIERTVVGQRGTYFCPTCQQLEIVK